MVAQNFGLASTSKSVHINTVYEKPSRNINFLMMAEVDILSIRTCLLSQEYRQYLAKMS